MTRSRKPVVIGTIAVIVLLAVFALCVALIPLITGPGVKTEPMDASRAKPATTDVDGTWEIVYGSAPNISSVGFTFAEVLPGERKVTSGSTRQVSGQVKVADQMLESGRVEVDMQTLNSDQEKRDINVRRKIFHTDSYPIAYFEVTDQVSLAGLPDDASVAQLVVPGEITIAGTTRPMSPTFDVVRDGDRIIMSTTEAINRLDFGLEAPEFVAAKIAEDGELNILLTLEKR